MAHKRSSSRYQEAGSSLRTSSSESSNAFLNASCNTPDITTPSSATYSQSSNSLSSAQSIHSDISLPSFTTNSASSSSESGLSSYAFSSSISSDQIPATTLQDQQSSTTGTAPCDCSTTMSRSRSPFEHLEYEPTGTYNQLKSSLAECMDVLKACLPDSLWDRLVFVAFGYYVYILFGALLRSSLLYHPPTVPCNLHSTEGALPRNTSASVSTSLEDLSLFRTDNAVRDQSQPAAPLKVQADGDRIALDGLEIPVAAPLGLLASSPPAKSYAAIITEPQTILAAPSSDDATGILAVPISHFGEVTENLPAHVLKHFDPAYIMYATERPHDVEDEPSVPQDGLEGRSEQPVLLRLD